MSTNRVGIGLVRETQRHGERAFPISLHRRIVLNSHFVRAGGQSEMEAQSLLFVLLLCWGALNCPGASPQILLPDVPTDPIGTGLARIAEEFLSGSLSPNAYQSSVDPQESLLREGVALLQNKEFSVIPTDDYPLPSRSQSGPVDTSTSFLKHPAQPERPRISSAPTESSRGAPLPAKHAESGRSPTHHLRGGADRREHVKQADRALPPSADLKAPAAEAAPSIHPELSHPYQESTRLEFMVSQIATPSPGPRRKHECSSCDSARNPLVTSGGPDETETNRESSVGRRLAAMRVGGSDLRKSSRRRLLADVLLPGPTALHMSKVDPSLNTTTADAAVQSTPWWAGQPIQTISKGPGDFKNSFQMPIGNITSLADLDDLTNDHLFDIFTDGLAEIPGGGEDDSGNYMLPTQKLCSVCIFT